jgi:hypothetical protein
MHHVTGRIDVVIIIAAVGERSASVPYKTDERRSEQIAHLFLILKTALVHRRPNDRWSGLAR